MHVLQVQSLGGIGCYDLHTCSLIIFCCHMHVVIQHLMRSGGLPTHVHVHMLSFSTHVQCRPIIVCRIKLLYKKHPVEQSLRLQLNFVQSKFELNYYMYMQLVQDVKFFQLKISRNNEIAINRYTLYIPALVHVVTQRLLSACIWLRLA